ncbi:MAG: hypothetical protein JNL73_21480 [Anaerolineales bacterium]|nr:hypothetical protein [Anaerolineales bacterium]
MSPGLFMNLPANDRYVGEASWAFFPYCTQDVHPGERTDAIHEGVLNFCQAFIATAG